jgi:hypothetical protein
MRLRPTPPQTFTVFSLLFIIMMVVVTDLTQSSFFRQAIINRESEIFHDIVSVLALKELSSSDLTH